MTPLNGHPRSHPYPRPAGNHHIRLLSRMKLANRAVNQAVIAGSEKVAPSWDWTPMGRIQFSAPDGWIEIRAGGDLGKRLTDAMAAGGAYRLTLVRPDPPPDYISGWQRASDDAWRAMGSLPDPITVDALNGILFRLAGEIDP